MADSVPDVSELEHGGLRNLPSAFCGRLWLHGAGLGPRIWIRGGLWSLGSETAPAPGFGPRTVDDGYLTASEAASMLGVAKSTVTGRIEKDEMVGFRMFKNALQVPREQFLDGNVVPGIPEILALFGTDTASAGRIDHKAAWMFLASTIYAGDAEPRPIDRLRAAAGTARIGNAVVELALAKESLDYGNPRLSAAVLATLPPWRRAAVVGLFDGLRTARPISNFVRVLASKHGGTPLGMGRGPCRFGPLPRPPLEGVPFSVLYASEDLATAVYETVIRDRFDVNPDRVLEFGDYSDRVAVNVSTVVGQSLALLEPDGRERGASRRAGRRDPLFQAPRCQHFSEFVHASMATVDGILYRSRFTEHFCVAVYHRAAHRVAATTPVPLTRPLVRGSLTDWNVDVL